MGFLHGVASPLVLTGHTCFSAVMAAPSKILTQYPNHNTTLLTLTLTLTLVTLTLLTPTDPETIFMHKMMPQ